MLKFMAYQTVSPQHSRTKFSVIEEFFGSTQTRIFNVQRLAGKKETMVYVAKFVVLQIMHSYVMNGNECQ